jgi:hypothetical protein
MTSLILQVRHRKCRAQGNVLGHGHDSKDGVARDWIVSISSHIGLVHLERAIVEREHRARRRGMYLLFALATFRTNDCLYTPTIAKLSASRVVLTNKLERLRPTSLNAATTEACCSTRGSEGSFSGKSSTHAPWTTAVRQPTVANKRFHMEAFLRSRDLGKRY